MVGLRVFVLFAAVGLMAQPPAMRPPVIDMMVRNYKTSDLLQASAPNPVTRLANGIQASSEHMAATISEMHRWNIRKAVVAWDFDMAQQWRRAEPDRVLVSAVFGDSNMPEPWPILASLEADFVAGRLHALGELALVDEQGELNLPRLDPYLAFAEKTGLPVAVRLVPRALPALRERLRRYPELNLWIVNAGWPHIAEAIDLMRGHPAVFADLSYINWAIPEAEFSGILQRFLTAGLTDRLMFGSDQRVWPEAVGMAIQSIESQSILSAAQKRAILHDNAARFLDIR